MFTRPAAHLAHVLPVALLALLPSAAAADWPSDPATNVPVSTTANGQRYPEAVRDGTGGLIVAWDDQRGGARDIYARRVDGTGTARWTDGGVALCAATGEQYEPKLVSDGAGGAIVTWSDWRGAAFDIYAQRVDSAGVVKWTANGVAICTATDFQSSPAIVADGSGGAIIAWADERSGIARIYAQRVNANGVVQWAANGVSLTNSVSGQDRPRVVSNGAGGAIVVWEDYRNGVLDFYGQRILSTGVIDAAWGAPGRAMAPLGGVKEGLALAADGSGGAFVSWAKFDGATHDVLVQHVLASSAVDPAWPAAGRAVLVDFYDQANPALLADGSGGVLVSWDDYRGATRDIYAHHILSTGALDGAWPAGGRALCTGSGSETNPRMVSDGAGGAIVVWHDWDDPDADIYANRVTSVGALDPDWPVNGSAITTASERQIVPTIVSNDAGGAVIAWQDGRNDPQNPDNTDIYAQRVKSNGLLGEGELDVPGAVHGMLALAPLSPNPNTGGAMVVRFTLATNAAASLELIDAAGRRVALRDLGTLGAGPHAIDLAPAGRPAAGVYFVRLQQQGQGARTQRVVLVDR